MLLLKSILHGVLISYFFSSFHNILISLFNSTRFIKTQRSYFLFILRRPPPSHLYNYLELLGLSFILSSRLYSSLIFLFFCKLIVVSEYHLIIAYLHHFRTVAMFITIKILIFLFFCGHFLPIFFHYFFLSHILCFYLRDLMQFKQIKSMPTAHLSW